MEKDVHDLHELLTLGRVLGCRTSEFYGKPVSIWLAQQMLRVRDRNGNEIPLEANTAQVRFERERGQHNIIVKARQMCVTTWVAGRFFLKTITARGVLSVQVAQTREAAESIFHIVQRLWECLPE